ncbi:MAG: Eco57I restriction-modification methylase domain-containing protein [Gaiellaceae bacterium]
MPLDAERARRHLAEFQLEPLFVEELGWDRYPSHLDVAVDGQTYRLRGVAEKRGMAAFVVESGEDRLPDYPTRRKIERQAAKSVHEHLIVYADDARTTQVWQWVRREPGRPTACRELHYQRGQSGEALIQRLDAVTFTLDEEADLSIVDVTRRARAAFDVERVTKRFYDLFKAEHEVFLGFIRGLESQDDREWYASVMLNRLMFVYFIQKKGFLDGDRDYLRHRLAIVQADAGRDQFHSFYRHFLLRLFHEGLGQRRRSSDLDAILGRVPYLNGGLFDVHELERENPEIQIPDEAFEQLFDFFDAYQWHLDDRPLRSDNEINPDVLGYIFEKYVNQKQMGAYYTKEDITGYITANALIPRLFEKLAERSDEFDFRTIAALLAAEPDRYLHNPLRHGTDHELPEEIAAGSDEPSRRDRWNASAAPSYALPTETWREVVARRQYYASLRARLGAGEVDSAADLVALNLNLQQLGLDLIEDCDSPALLGSIYAALESLSVLDPTCGSGAFLFAALNILEPLYEAALERMEAFLVDADADDARLAEFAAVIDRVRAHPNRAFFTLKSIVVNNLYGVDIMEEAIEICKLRLFLRLVAQVSSVEHLEPLPDVDFHVRAGNTLVGFASLAEAREAIQGGAQARLDVADALVRIVERAADADAAFERFHSLQLQHGEASDAEQRSAKKDLRSVLSGLRGELDRYLAGEYGVNESDVDELAAWRLSHQPFHWFTEFYGLMRGGGFDVVIGNPPYLEVGRLNGRYRPLDFRTLGCRDIYAWVVERAGALAGSEGHVGLIVPVSISSSGSFAPLRDVIMAASATLSLSHFANRPGQLFAGAQNRLTIFLRAPSDDGTRIFSTRYYRWDSRRGERENLFALLRYVELADLAIGFHGLFPKIGTPEAASILRKMHTRHTVAERLVRHSEHSIYWVRVPGYFCQFYLTPPMARPEAGGPARVRGEVNSVFLPDERTQRVLHAVLNSSTYYQFYVAYSDGRHINQADVRDFMFDFSGIAGSIVDKLVALSHQLEEATREHTSLWRKSGLLIDSLDSRPLKPLLDEIDVVLAEHYGLSDTELDFLVNYDLKYRIGSDEET